MLEYVSLLIGFVLVVACFLWIMYYLVFTDKFEQQLQKRVVDKIGKKDEK
jgi:hypothetical protein